VLGAFGATGLIMALVLYFKERRTVFLMEAVLAYSGMMVSVCRAAVIASVVVAAVAGILLLRAPLLDWRRVVRVAGTLVVCPLVLMPAIYPLYVERFSKLNVSDVSADSETALRVVTMFVALEDIAEHPVLGNGTSSFQLAFSGRQLGMDASSDEV